MFYMRSEGREVPGNTAELFDLDAQTYPRNWTSSSWSGSGWGIWHQRGPCDTSPVSLLCPRPFFFHHCQRQNHPDTPVCREAPSVRTMTQKHHHSDSCLKFSLGSAWAAQGTFLGVARISTEIYMLFFFVFCFFFGGGGCLLVFFFF